MAIWRPSGRMWIVYGVCDVSRSDCRILIRGARNGSQCQIVTAWLDHVNLVTVRETDTEWTNRDSTSESIIRSRIKTEGVHEPVADLENQHSSPIRRIEHKCHHTDARRAGKHPDSIFTH